MTADELNHTLDAMQQDAAGNADRMPGLITVQTADLIDRISDVRAKCSALHDGLRHRDVVIRIGAAEATKVLTRAEAGENGQPFRDLTPIEA